MTFDEWLRKRWYIFAISVGMGAAVSQLFISNRYPVTIGFLVGFGLTYLIYKIQTAERPGVNKADDATDDPSD